LHFFGGRNEHSFERQDVSFPVDADASQRVHLHVTNQLQKPCFLFIMNHDTASDEWHNLHRM
jgi:hypothetical protein